MSKQQEKTYNPKEIESKLYDKWLEKKYFHAEVDRSKKTIYHCNATTEHYRKITHGTCIG